MAGPPPRQLCWSFLAFTHPHHGTLPRGITVLQHSLPTDINHSVSWASLGEMTICLLESSQFYFSILSLFISFPSQGLLLFPLHLFIISHPINSSTLWGEHSPPLGGPPWLLLLPLISSYWIPQAPRILLLHSWWFLSLPICLPFLSPPSWHPLSSFWIRINLFLSTLF